LKLLHFSLFTVDPKEGLQTFFLVPLGRHLLTISSRKDWLKHMKVCTRNSTYNVNTENHTISGGAFGSIPLPFDRIGEVWVGKPMEVTLEDGRFVRTSPVMQVMRNQSKDYAPAEYATDLNKAIRFSTRNSTYVVDKTNRTIRGGVVGSHPARYTGIGDIVLGKNANVTLEDGRVIKTSPVVMAKEVAFSPSSEVVSGPSLEVAFSPSLEDTAADVLHELM
jgi:hypothetical protein